MAFMYKLAAIFMKNYYEILNISRNAQENDIKKAYRKLSMIWHPDVNKNPNAHSMFIEINEAYEILINTTKRNEYDKIFKDNKQTETSTEYREWQDKAKQNAEAYAKMNSEEFNTKISKELKLAGKYSVTFGCFILLVFGAIINIWAIFEIGPFALVSVIAFGGGAIYLYNISLKGYFEERKDL